LEAIEFLKRCLECHDAIHFNKFWGVVLEKLEVIEFLKHHLECHDATHFNKFWGVVLEIGGDRATYGVTSHFWDIAFSPRFSSKASKSGLEQM
jgi:hypothetical protein